MSDNSKPPADEAPAGGGPSAAAPDSQTRSATPRRRSDAAGLVIACLAAVAIVGGAIAYVRAPRKSRAAPVRRLAVHVEAFYPGDEDHTDIEQLVLGFPKQYPGVVSAEFIDFRQGEGFDRWRAAGLNCGAVLVNGKQTVVTKDRGGEREVTFTHALGGEWTADDLRAAVAQAVAEAAGGSAREP
jgi:hypothetical protein